MYCDFPSSLYIYSKMQVLEKRRKRTCENSECHKTPVYGPIGTKSGKRCFVHKQQNDVNVQARRCEVENCDTVASFCSISQKTAIRCATHKFESDLNISKCCRITSCFNRAIFGHSIMSTPVRCELHKREADVISIPRLKTCEVVGCKTIPVFSEVGSKCGKRCFRHKLADDIDCKSKRCRTEGCTTRSFKKYEYFCYPCYVMIYPESTPARNYLIKERSVAFAIEERFGSYFSIIRNRIIEPIQSVTSGVVSECIVSLRRPDFLIDFGSYVLIIEVDEDQHRSRSYTQECEARRVNEIFTTLGDRHIVFIRFNPDTYVQSDGTVVLSPWTTNSTNRQICIRKSQYEVWKERLNTLLDTIDFCSKNCPEEMITYHFLFYDKV